MELSERKLKILQAIIADFIASGEPVGSRTLSKRLDMNISPATIRNEMADLEDMGYLTHPHTSAGRVPSDMAYRLYVDQMMQHSELPEEEKKAISQKMADSAVELDKTIEHAAEILSEMTNMMSFAITPKADERKLKYINFLPVDERTVVLMIVAEDGKVSNTAIKLNCDYSEDNLELMSKVMTHNFRGRTVSQVLTMDIIDMFESDINALGNLPGSVMPSFIKTLENMLNVELYMDGYTNIFDLPEYSDVNKASNLLQLVENKDEFTQVLVNRDSGLVVTIGDENSPDMKDCSLITADYKVNGKLVGKLGVIGPKRMKYGEISSVIKYITDNISKTFQIEGPAEGSEDTDSGPHESGAEAPQTEDGTRENDKGANE